MEEFKSLINNNIFDITPHQSITKLMHVKHLLWQNRLTAKHLAAEQNPDPPSSLNEIFNMQDPKYSPCCGSSSQKIYQNNQQLPIKKRRKCKYDK